MADSLPPLPLPAGIKSSYVDCTASVGLTIHTLEAGEASSDKPLVLLVHGFPELAFSWRHVMPKLAAAGYYVVAYDQRGYGRTTGWDTSKWADVDLTTFRVTQLARDAIALVNRLGRKQVDCIVGHDFGGVTSATCALSRPDFFKRAIMMSHPFAGTPVLPFGPEGSTDSPGQLPRDADIQQTLAQLDPPKKHYKWYNTTSTAADEWDNPKQGLKTFLRGYVHFKSAKYAGNKPHALGGFTAKELIKMPEYYILPLHKTMPEVVADTMADEDELASKSFMPDEDLDVYVQEWSRTGFQGGLNWYRSVAKTDNNKDDMLLMAGKKILVPCAYTSGIGDWGNYQEPGAIQNYPNTCTDFRWAEFIEGAGHWPQQEQPEKVTEIILKFLKETGL